MTRNIENIDTKCIISAKLAKKLILLGFRVLDIKPNNKNEFASIFIFEKTNELMQVVNEWLMSEAEKQCMKNKRTIKIDW